MYCVRPATPADAGALQSIYASCLQTADWLPALSRVRPDFAGASRGETVFVATMKDGRVVGLVAVWTLEDFIHHLYVAPAFRRRGVGQLLLASLDAWLAPPWRLKCVRKNHRAYAFYRQLGWIEVGAGSSADGPFALLEWAPGPVS